MNLLAGAGEGPVAASPATPALMAAIILVAFIMRLGLLRSLRRGSHTQDSWRQADIVLSAVVPATPLRGPRLHMLRLRFARLL